MKALNEQELKDRIENTMQSHLEANKVKDFLEAEGYTFQWSLYGIIYNPESKQFEFRRIEIFTNGIPKRKSILQIKQRLTEFPPLDYYSIWAYNLRTNRMINIDGWS